MRFLDSRISLLLKFGPAEGIAFCNCEAVSCVRCSVAPSGVTGVSVSQCANGIFCECLVSTDSTYDYNKYLQSVPERRTGYVDSFMSVSFRARFSQALLRSKGDFPSTHLYFLASRQHHFLAGHLKAGRPRHHSGSFITLLLPDLMAGCGPYFHECIVSFQDIQSRNELFVNHRDGYSYAHGAPPQGQY
jgi:hypothetical protein